MTEELMKEMGAEDWPKGLYMIFAKDQDAIRGKVIGLTRTTAIYHRWDEMFGGVDETVADQVLLTDFNEFISFDDIWEMESYFEEHGFQPMRGEIKMGEIK